MVTMTVEADPSRRAVAVTVSMMLRSHKRTALAIISII